MRKTCFASLEEADKPNAFTYSPDTHHYCTIYAGTYVQQVLPVHPRCAGTAPVKAVVCNIVYIQLLPVLAACMLLSDVPM